MISRRVTGLQNILLLAQVLVALVVFVLAGVIAFTLLTSFSWDYLGRYVLYAVLIVVGLFLEASQRRRTTAQFDPIFVGFIGQQGVTLRQVTYAIGVLLCYLALVKDHVIARTFLVTYVPMLYLGLLASKDYTRSKRMKSNGSSNLLWLILGALFVFVFVSESQAATRPPRPPEPRGPNPSM